MRFILSEAKYIELNVLLYPSDRLCILNLPIVIVKVLVSLKIVLNGYVYRQFVICFRQLCNPFTARETKLLIE